MGNRSTGATGQPRNTIVLTPDPQGKFIEGYLDPSYTIYPGMAMELTPASEGVTTRYYRPYQGSTGALTPVIIATEDALEGCTVFTQYAAGSRVFGYIPLPGDEMQLLVDQPGGTGSLDTFGEQLIIANGGYFEATTGSPALVPFTTLESNLHTSASQGFVAARRN